MHLVPLGSTGMMASRLCFGTLSIGSLQGNLPLDQGVFLLNEAFHHGVNFFDTAATYGSYPYLRAFLAHHDRSEIVIATKSYADSAAAAKAALEQALWAIGTEYIDIFLLHEQTSEASLRGHQEALDFYLWAKEQGLIRAVGLSTHHIAAVRASVMREEIEVVHPIYNSAGFGIQDGSAQEMLAAIGECALMGKAIYVMKALGGGHLLAQAQACLEHVAAIDSIHSIAVGMQSGAEIRANTAIISGEEACASDRLLLRTAQRRLHIGIDCQRCGKCLETCPTAALSLGDRGLAVDRERCILCGYCGRSCPHFAIKVL